MSFFLKLISPILKSYIKSQSNRRLPQLDGTVQLKGLKEPVEIIRDKWGIPHIYASSMDDLFFAQGFVHAQDRLFQMEMMSRITTGTLSALVGEDTLQVDRISRTLGFERLAQADFAELSKRPEMDYVLAYRDGVNAWIDQLDAKTIPVEYQLLKTSPRKWDAIHTLSISRFISFQMSYGWMIEMQRAEMAAIVGLEHASELDVNYPDYNPSVLNKHKETNHFANDGRLEAFTGPYLNGIKGSNNWTVAGAKMESGKPFVCNDPHLIMGEPMIWYENHLITADYTATGVSIPGSPFIMIGHNRNIAWGMTLAFCDLQDLYIEKFTDESCTHYEFKGEKKAATIREEKIEIKGKKTPHIERVVETHHGPVISDVIGEEKKKLALASMALRPTEMILGFYGINMAKDWDDFVKAVAYIQAPSLSIVYGDTKGNTGYWATGKVPIRDGEKTGLPREGWTGENEWIGFVPFEEMPHAYNPEKGIIYTCNHKLIDDDYPHYIGNGWMNGYRAHRLEQLFSEKEQFSKADFKKWHRDCYSIPGRQLAGLYQLVKSQHSNVQQAIDELVNWDGYLTTDTVGGTIYEVVKQQLIDIVIGSKLNQKLKDGFKGVGPDKICMPLSEYFGHDTNVILRLLNNPDSWWMQEAGGSEKVLLEAINKAVTWLKKKLGANMSQWHWGKLHYIVFQHPFGEQEPMDKIFNVGPHPLIGDPDTLLQASFAPDAPFGGPIVSASYRQLIDLSDFSNSETICPTGQSGNIMSPYYNNQLDPWLKGSYHPMLWTRKQVEEHQAHNLTISS